MKQQRLRFKLLALFLFGLFALLAVYGGYAITTYGNRWFAYTRNPRIRAQKENVIAGDVLDRSGVVLATTVDGTRIYQADESARRAVVHLLGDDQGQVSNGVETFQSNYLYGFQASLPELINSLFDGQPRRGDNVTLTIDSRLCTAIVKAFGAYSLTAGKNGAAVVMNYRTGETLGMVSLPTFDPMNITESTANDPGQPFWNRATQSVYPPGSSFKIITTDAALTSLPGIQDTEIACTGGLDVAGQAIRDYGNAVHNSLSLKRAFTVSCNNVYALLAIRMKDDALRRAAESFGFNDNFLFKDIVVENSVYPTTNRTSFELATSGFGQSAIVASPMHLCLVAAAIANDGVIMEPQLLRQVTSTSGALRTSFSPRVYRTATTAANAALIQDYMRSVVTSGTGTRAAVSGLTVCGKTGSAESSLNGRAITYGWFVGYIADDDLPFALAVVVEDIPDGEGGGSTAAPIAGDIFQYLKDNQTRVTQ
ncbi:MAG: penicillin-binding protein 2 [Christensenellaceae bacterium]|nr:penicillin-binding protein 2 [Christensenellaceae bacterium]